jgi:hypothetical protein
LQLDLQELADAMLEQAAGFGTNPSASTEPAPFVGSRRCATCHNGIYRAQQNSPHSRTISFGRTMKDVPLPPQVIPDPRNPEVNHHFSRTTEDQIALETRVGDQVARAVMTYAMGSGRHGITMVAKDDRFGIERQLRISYFRTAPTWGETKIAGFVPVSPEDYLGPGLSHKALRQCLHCHTTWFRAADPLPSIPPGPEAQDRGIGCERCHGPGLNHVKAVESGFAERAIRQTSRTPSAQLLGSCNECHASNGTVEPSDPEFTRVQGTTLMFSRCFTRSQGQIHCTTCHDPHRRLETNPKHYEARCLSCHARSPARPGRATHPPAGAPSTLAVDRAPPCPINSSGKCITCHMPKVPDPSLHARFTDHHIRVFRVSRTRG